MLHTLIWMPIHFHGTAGLTRSLCCAPSPNLSQLGEEKTAHGSDLGNERCFRGISEKDRRWVAVSGFLFFRQGRHFLRLGNFCGGLNRGRYGKLGPSVLIQAESQKDRGGDYC